MTDWSKILHPGACLISDIAAGHAETMFGRGRKTLAALADLVNICQAAILHEEIVASPTAILNNSLLRDLDFVSRWHISATGEEGGFTSDIGARDLDFGESSEIEIEPGDLLWTMAFWEKLGEDAVFGPLVNPRVLPGDVDVGRRYLTMFPAIMMLNQFQRNVPIFKDDASREYFAREFAPSIDRYSQCARLFAGLYERYGVSLVSSCIEQPLMDFFRPGDALFGTEVDNLHRTIAKKLNVSVETARGYWLSEWQLPAVGLVALAQAETLDALPRVIHQARERFKDLRQTVAKLETERRAAVEDGEAGRKVLLRIEAELTAAFKRFTDRIKDEAIYGGIIQREGLVRGLEFVDDLLATVTSLGVGAVKLIVNALNLEDRLKIQLVPGLLKAASFFENANVPSVAAVVERYTGLPEARAVFPRTALQFAFHQLEHSYVGGLGNDDGVLRFHGNEFVGSGFWTTLAPREDKSERTKELMTQRNVWLFADPEA